MTKTELEQEIKLVKPSYIGSASVLPDQAVCALMRAFIEASHYRVESLERRRLIQEAIDKIKFDYPAYFR